MKKLRLALAILLGINSLGFCYPVYGNRKPIALHPENPHYFIYQGKPTVLITSGEHYGAVLNLDFDYKTYLYELQSHGLNLTRTFSGAYVEAPVSFNIRHNTLAPASDRFICPWKRVSSGDYKFDLSQWNPAYFKRLKKFIATARKRHIIVEFTLFCPFYGDEQWALSPLNAKNNVNGWGKVSRTDVYTLDKSGKLLAVQEAMVRKLVQELKKFDNVMYEICNEPYFGGVTLEWQRHIGALIRDTEKGWRYQHLITQNIANGHQKITDPFPMVSVFNFHYATPPVAVSENYALNKVIGDNETGFKGNEDVTYREEAWHFMLAGGGLFNNLDYSFAVGDEKGTYDYPDSQPGGGSLALRRQLGFLKTFLEGFNFIHLHPDADFISGSLSDQTKAHVLSDKGKQYAVYLSGSPVDQLKVALPAGRYEATWYDPKTAARLSQKLITSKAGQALLEVPDFTADIALRLIRTPGS